MPAASTTQRGLTQALGRYGEIMRPTVFLILWMLSASALGSELVATVPAQFLGTWGSGSADCGSDTDDLTLRIDSDYIAFHESSGPIKAIVIDGHYQIALIAELSGEGDKWLATTKFRLSSHGARLVDETSVPGQKVVRHRCLNFNGARPNNSFKPKPLRGSA